MRTIKSKNFKKKCKILEEILCKKGELQTHIGKLNAAKNHRSARQDILIEQAYGDINNIEQEYLDNLVMLATELEKVKESWPWIV